MLVDRCAELGLLTTGSSDFHGPHHREFKHFRAFETYGLSAEPRPALRLTPRAAVPADGTAPPAAYLRSPTAIGLTCRGFLGGHRS